ncbi:DUF2250 domain-containing protein [Picrophilus oshimae]|uniref:Predicted transciptional regulator, contains HTH domain n=1 Tax=Picrophilus torridus (strain ATCC 700027 / DSM 9790 / JCM 10055 / NBRC 100828 / KAW 2/3) TaxID=1122961 RepID=Q6KZK1_PICTO|nr:DUF2250 domain-containing protein [Picrophilus oshimae]AAT43851.1 hypothetical protein PTO1266 [Picrophilus oshimae DSM 9789]SMD31080.1 Predicted transciptional regulator, contains HTH domain [Picrophilus oshimae DSM 9789]
MEDEEIKRRLIENNEMLTVLEHFQVAKVDYAKNIMRYTEIPKMKISHYLGILYDMGLLEKYTNTSIKRTDAKLKKSAEVHKHHTYYQMTNKAHYILKDLDAREYIKYVTPEDLKILKYKKARDEFSDSREKLVKMGLLTKKYELTEIGQQVLDLALRRQIKIPEN